MSRLPDPASVPRRLLGGDGSSLDPLSSLLLDAVDNRSSIASLADVCGIEAELAGRIVAELARRGLLSVPGFEAVAAGDSSPPGRPSGAPAADRGSAEDLAAEVHRTFHALRQWNFYEILGVAPDADRKAIRSAYFALSKKFHPDRAFGADAADLRKKMEVIFRRLTQAYEVTTNAGQRAEYDTYIADQIAVWKMEQQLLQALKPEEPAPAPVSSEPPPPATATPAPPPPPSSPPEPRQARPSTPAAARPDHDSRRRSWQRERAQRMLHQALGGAPGGGTVPPRRRPRPEEVEDLIGRGRVALEAGACAEAVRLFTEALGLDPGSERAAAALADAKERAILSLSAGYLRQGHYERLQGDFERARASLAKAIEINPRSVEARFQLADLLFSAKRELSQALTLSREVIALGGQKARYFAILGELLLMAKETDRARESFSRAVQQEPDNREYRKRLKSCGG